MPWASKDLHNQIASIRVLVTGGYGYTPGVYFEEGTRNGGSLYISEDRSAELFFSEREDDDDDDSEDNRRQRRATRRRLLPQDMLDDSEKAVSVGEGGSAAKRRLGACTSGFWSLAPAGSGYPRLTVGDCASHPADIKVTAWSEVTCEGCEEQAFNGAVPAVACTSDNSLATPSPSAASTSTADDTSNGGGGDSATDDGGEVGAQQTPSPVASAPEIVVDDSCKVIDVVGRYPGLYTVAGSYNERGDFYSADGGHNIFFEESSAAASEGDDEDDDEDDDDDSDDDSDDGDRRRRMLRGLFGERSAQQATGRNLAACSNGYWIKMPTGGGYPLFAVADCAAYPEEIASSSTWMIVTCEGCVGTEATSSQTITCATGADAFVATPSPVSPVVAGGGETITLPGAGPSTCEAVTVTGPRAGGYTVGGSINGAADVYSDDGLWRMFFASPAPALSRRARRSLHFSADGGDAGPLSAELAPDTRDTHDRRGLQTCDGYWYITPVDDRYPAYAVMDCGEHPVDIVSSDWLYLDCEDCEVVTADSKPDASCTGAPANIKRGGSFNTPAPVVLDFVGTPGPDTSSSGSASTTCTELYVTGEFPGNYTANGTYRGKLDFFNDDGTVNLYFELADSSRRLLSSAGEEREGGRRLLPGELMASALEERYHALAASRRLAICTSGYWIITQVAGDGYPVLGVPDCADHPVDIRANTWLVASCESCGVQEAPSFVAPTIACASGAAGGGAGGATPSPALPAICGTVYVTGPAAGVYVQQGDYGTRGDFFSGNNAWNMYWTFYAGKPVNRNRFRRGLSVPEDRAGSERWSEEYELALQTLADDLFRRKEAGRSADWNGRRKLEVCDDGFWLITPRGGGFPFYGTLNCADHPADISNLAAWSVVECDGCGSEPLDGTVTVTISCDGADFTPPPSTTSGDTDVGVGGGTPSPAGVVGGTPSPAAASELPSSSGSVLRNTGVVVVALVAAAAVLA
ncbi:unnamed protein product [Ectocarpus sp. CCAP 1310/34]|nr:unnamed protein product [Ectocarpus sp. CCAP 1310/34]